MVGGGGNASGSEGNTSVPATCIRRRRTRRKSRRNRPTNIGVWSYYPPVEPHVLAGDSDDAKRYARLARWVSPVATADVRRETHGTVGPCAPRHPAHGCNAAVL